MKNLKSDLQNVWENLAYQTKCFFKSHDIAVNMQQLLLSGPIILTIISFYMWGFKLLDYISFTLSIMALCYYIYAGKNTELFKAWWEKYLVLYKETEQYFKLNSSYDEGKINQIVKKQNELWMDNSKPNIHIFSKYWTDKVIEKEMTYGNESVVWWKK